MQEKNNLDTFKELSTLQLLKVIFIGNFQHYIFFKFWTKWKHVKHVLKKRSLFHWLLAEGIELVFIILPAVLVFRHFVLQSSLVPSPSMYPTLKVGDRLIVSRFIYRFTDPKRLDIVVFQSKEKTNNKQYVKRLVGLPGETLEIKRGVVYIDGKQLIFPGVNIQRDFKNLGPILIPEGNYFVLGDNRPNSLDSRYWGFVKRKEFIGEAWFTFWPPQQMGILQ